MASIPGYTIVSRNTFQYTMIIITITLSKVDNYNNNADNSKKYLEESRRHRGGVE